MLSPTLFAALLSTASVASAATPDRPQCLAALEEWSQSLEDASRGESAPDGAPKAEAPAPLPEGDLLASCWETLAEMLTPSRDCIDVPASLWIELGLSCDQPRRLPLPMFRRSRPTPPPALSWGRAATPQRSHSGDDHVQPLAGSAFPWAAPIGCVPWSDVPDLLPPSAERERLERPPRPRSTLAV